MDDKMYFLQNKTKNNQNLKEIGVQQVEVDSKTIIEAVV